MQLRITKPLLELQTDGYKEVTSALYKHITETSDFPEWKQANYADTSSEYGFKELAGTLTVDEQAHLDYIRLVRAWKNQLLVERDRVKIEIQLAGSILEIITARDSMMYTPIP